MPYEMRMAGDLLVIELSDPLSAADLHAGTEALERHEKSLDVTPDRVLDVRTLSAPAVDFNTLYATAERRKTFVPKNPIRTAIVATSPVALGYARMYQTLMASHPLITLRLFDNFEEAERWARGGEES